MENRDIQIVLSAAGFYAGGIDGILGRKSEAAIQSVETAFADNYTFSPSGSTEARRRAAAVQACLSKLGYSPGAVDGWMGPNTLEALNFFLFKTVNGRDEVILRQAQPDAPVADGVPDQADVGRVYGTPGPEIEARLVMLRLPFKLRIDWNTRQTTNKIRVHELAAQQLEAALIEVHSVYGEDKWHALGLDRYAGAYTHRRMRGGSKYSMHAYGCAIDFHPTGNALRTPFRDSVFGRPEYTDFLDIMEAHEWLSAGRMWGADAMHFQRARV